LHHCRLTDTVLSALAACRFLSQLALHSCQPTSPHLFQQLAQLPLTCLCCELDGDPAPGLSVGPLAACTTLTSLHLSQFHRQVRVPPGIAQPGLACAWLADGLMHCHCECAGHCG
jgi:hypothetical protein